MPDEQEQNPELNDGFLEEAFGSTADEEFIDDVDDDEAEADVSGTVDGTEDDDEDVREPEGEEDDFEDEETEDDNFDDEAEADDDEEDDDEDLDDTAEDDSDVGDDSDAESEEDGDSPEGEGGDEDAVSDGMLALDMMVDQRLASFVPPGDDFDPESTVGTEEQFIEAAREAFGEDFDEDYAVKMGKAQYKSAVNAAQIRHKAGAKDRLLARRDQATKGIRAQVAELAGKVPAELLRVEARMARIYQDKCDRFGVDAANEIPVEAYFRLAGGNMKPPKVKAKASTGTATKKAKAQKRKAVRSQPSPDHLVRNRTGKRKRRTKDDQVGSAVSDYLNTHKAIEDFFFGNE